MPKDVWSEDRVQREVALQERSDAVANDTTPTINALAPLVDEKPRGTLLRRVSDGWVILAEEDEAADLIAAGDYRPFTATEGFTDSGTLCCQADPEWVAFGRKERIMALARFRSGDAVARVVQDELARLAGLSDEELERLGADLTPAHRG